MDPAPSGVGIGRDLRPGRDGRLVLLHEAVVGDRVVDMPDHRAPERSAGRPVTTPADLPASPPGVPPGVGTGATLRPVPGRLRGDVAVASSVHPRATARAARTPNGYARTARAGSGAIVTRPPGRVAS